MNKTKIDDLTTFLLAVDAQADAVALRERSYKLFAPKPGDTVLDVGSGGGTAVGELLARGMNAIGVDVSADALAVARELHPDARFEQAGAEELPFANGSIDGYRAEKLYQRPPQPRRTESSSQAGESSYSPRTGTPPSSTPPTPTSPGRSSSPPRPSSRIREWRAAMARCSPAPASPTSSSRGGSC
ncbi:class I SAM-dependent methyltransferase [Tenggerimyces flavus]|uniref:Class I SAM-dependent methyltransferase n=1 Tax=Tenggerimyces flavus TaxID=1708749 RepID=A0ABV7YG72_9ACTN|nr:methyltransferase domain-containing protein [Tenggerimyces flavus]MBM7787830.1 hypothetical protein [Tenggerimyces flavus]